MELNDFYNTPGVKVKSAEQVVESEAKEAEERQGIIDKVMGVEEIDRSYDELTQHVLDKFYTHRNARRESGIEQDMIDDLYQVSGMYRPGEIEDLNGSNIFMNITATKQRAAKSWIRDIILPANVPPFEIVTSKSEDIPPAIKEMMYEAFLEDEKRLSKEIEEKYAEMAKNASGEGEKPQGPSEEQMQQMSPEEQEQAQMQMQAQEANNKLPPSALIASKKLKEISKLKRDIEESIIGEIHKVAQHDVRKLNRDIEDELRLGGFEGRLDSFIEDFTTFPTAFMKGPIVTTAPRLEWENGVPMEIESRAYKDARINALDAYPSPGAEHVHDGDFIEHIRVTAKELADFAKLDPSTGYKQEILTDIILNEKSGSPFWSASDIEEDKALIEKRGSQWYSNTDLYHGLHFWGSISVQMLQDWGMTDEELVGKKIWEQMEVEVMMIGHRVVKCRINKDPLKRRPYYAASFHPRSGSIWGRSLPNLMRDIQGMCNAAARALADNMGMASGPQMAILVDRLADDGDIEEQEPFKIWQFKSDPQGNGGKPVEYFIAPSNAQELLAVYDNFEVKADDVTGVPRYAYGNERTGGAGQTASGLSMLLESASKGIKSAVMNIAKGLIVPRVEFQAYLHLLALNESDDPFKFNGDLNVVVKAVENITIKAAQQQLRKELLQVTSNPQDIKIMGMEGRGLLLREIFADVGLPEDAIPDRLELKELQARTDANEQKQIDAQAQAGDKSVEATKVQIEGQMAMHDKTVAQQDKQLQANVQMDDKGKSIDVQKINQRERESARREAARIEESKRVASTKVGVAIADAQAKEEKNETEPRTAKAE